MTKQKKSFNASSLSGSNRNITTNNVSITFMNLAGTRQTVNLSPQAQHQLMKVLLARPPLDQNKSAHDQLVEPEKILQVQGLRRIVLPNNNPGLELLLAPGMSIYITFPREGIAAFLDLLSTFDEFAEWKNQKIH